MTSERPALVELFVPELVADLEQKTAQVAQDDVMIKAAGANRGSVAREPGRLPLRWMSPKPTWPNIADVDRWYSEVNRLTRLATQKVVDNQVLEESRKQLQSTTASRNAADANIRSAQANRLARKADLDKSRVDVDAARAKAKVTQAEEHRAAALLAYTKITAPYDGTVVARNANTGDFVQPAAGDQSTRRGSTDASAQSAAPIYVLARTDLVRVYVDVPEMDANYVAKGTQARVRIPAFDHAEVAAKVTRTSWSLNVQTRSLRAEIDLPNRDRRLLPACTPTEWS